MLKELYATLAELESGTVDSKELKIHLSAKLETLYDILEEEVDEEYWGRIEKFI